MFSRIREIAMEANFHWKDVAIILLVGAGLIILTDHISANLCN